MTIDAFPQQARKGEVFSLANSLRNISPQGSRTTLSFIDDWRKRVGSEITWIGKGEEPPLSVPPTLALRVVVTAETAQSPLGRGELNDPMDYGNKRTTNSNYSLDPSRREARVTALVDDRVLLMASCESGACSTVQLAQLVSCQRPHVARQVWLTLPFQPLGETPQEIELIDTSYDDRRHELMTLDKGRGADDCGIRAR